MQERPFMKFNFKSVLMSLMIASTLGLGLVPGSASTAHAWDHWNRGGYQGHWMHDRHEGRLGWWWIVGPRWYYYSRPYPIYPPQTVILQPLPQPPQQVVIQQAPPMQIPLQQPVQIMPQPPVVQATPVLYYCKSTETYYPDTMTCPGGWTTMAAGAPPAN